MTHRTHDFRKRSAEGAVAETAARWVVRRDAGLSADEIIAFEAWRAADPLHAAEFARITASWRKIEGLAVNSALIDEADAIVRRARFRQVRRRKLAIFFAPLAVAAALTVAYLGWKPPAGHPGNYQILTSTSRQLELPDGSLALLNGDSKIETEYTVGERKIKLVRGEVLFTVAKNPDRPFLVTAGTITVRAVGTAFNVRLASTSVEVLVTEGKVRVNDSANGSSILPVASDSADNKPVEPGYENPILTAGHRVWVDFVPANAVPRVQVAEVAPYEMEQALAWQNTRLVFNDTPLAEVVDAFNRCNSHKLILGEEILGSRKITGVFRADNLDGFTRLLQAGLDIGAERRSDHETVLLRSR